MILETRSSGIPLLLEHLLCAKISFCELATASCFSFDFGPFDGVELIELVCMGLCVQCDDDDECRELVVETDDFREAEAEGAMMIFHIVQVRELATVIEDAL